MVVGDFHSLMASNFLGSILISPWPMIPRNLILGASKTVLESFTVSPVSGGGGELFRFIHDEGQHCPWCGSPCHPYRPLATFLGYSWQRYSS